jgi:hypothetical protein
MPCATDGVDTPMRTMFRRRYTPFIVVLTALVLAGIAVAAPTDPQIEPDAVDQVWAESIVLAPTDLGTGWRDTTVMSSGSGDEEASTFCPEANLDLSDLIVTAGGYSEFSRGPSSVSSFAVAFRTPEQAQAYFDRTVGIMPALQKCTASLFGISPGGVKIVVAGNAELRFPAVAVRIAAYRIRVVIKSAGRTKKQRKPLVVNWDTIAMGNGRAAAWLYVSSYSSRPVSLAKEISLATALADRMGMDPAGT